MSKVGRNDPCPCGSGKKYKKCCGASAKAPRKFQATVLSQDPLAGRLGSRMASVTSRIMGGGSQGINLSGMVSKASGKINVPGKSLPNVAPQPTEGKSLADKNIEKKEDSSE